jgi:predicted pyridoxine 5'-phosphate oxidase superfamily flavin-nucleotide-binding protein
MIAQSCGVLNRHRGLRHGLSAYIGVTPVHLGDIPMTAYSSDVAFTPTVKALQEQRGSRSHYAKMEAKGGWRTAITADLAGFLAEARSLYLATANAEGQPYIQHRGGPPGFVRVIDERTLGFADFKGNRQYITTGNLADNPRAYIFVMDYAQRRRVKLWGRARVVENDDALLARLWPEGYQARPEQVILFEIEAWDTNCPQHIPQMFHAEDVGQTILQFQARIRELEAELAALKSGKAG